MRNPRNPDSRGIHSWARAYGPRAVLQKSIFADSFRTMARVSLPLPSFDAGKTPALDAARANRASAQTVGTTASVRAFAVSMIGLGMLGFVYTDFALVWQRVPIEPQPGRAAIADACAAIE